MIPNELTSFSQSFPLVLPGQETFDLFVASFKPATGFVIAGSSPIIRQTSPAADQVPTLYSKLFQAVRQSKQAGEGVASSGPLVYALGDGPKAEENLFLLTSRLDALTRWGGDYGKDNLAYLKEHGAVAIKVGDGQGSRFDAQQLTMDKRLPQSLIVAVEKLAGSSVAARDASFNHILHADGRVSHDVHTPVRDNLTGLSHARGLTVENLGADYSLATQALCAATADKLGLPLPEGSRMSAGEARQLMRDAGIELLPLRDLLPASPGQAIAAAKASFDAAPG